MASRIQEFEQRMRRDRAFRQRILAARKAGSLPETLAQEGYDLSLLEVQQPQVRTGLHGGQCYCLIVSERREIE